MEMIFVMTSSRMKSTINCILHIDTYWEPTEFAAFKAAKHRLEHQVTLSEMATDSVEYKNLCHFQGSQHLFQILNKYYKNEIESEIFYNIVAYKS